VALVVLMMESGTAGLGFESIVELAKHKPSQIFFTGRNSERAEKIVEDFEKQRPDVPLTFLECDLAFFASVITAADQFLSLSSRLDILICNAGIMAKPPGLTTDGYELQFGTNHMGHALLIQKLLPTLLSTADAGADVRVVILTSLGFRGHPKGGIDFPSLKTTRNGFIGHWVRYAHSKLANLLYARELARRHPNITCVSVHPGVVKTGLVSDLRLADKFLVYITNVGRMMNPGEGAWNQLWAATGNKADIQNGQFYEPVGVLSNNLTRTSQDDDLAARLYDWTDSELKPFMI